MKRLLIIIIIAGLAWYLFFKVIKDFDYERAFSSECMLDKALHKAEKG